MKSLKGHILSAIVFFLVGFGGLAGMQALGKGQKFGFSQAAQPFIISTGSSTAGVPAGSATTTEFFGSVSPQVSNLYDLGRDGRGWRNVYVSTTIFGDISTASSTFTRLFWINATGTNLFTTRATSTDWFATNATATNFSATNFTPVNLTWTNATGTNLVTTDSTSTRFFATSATTTNFFTTNLGATNYSPTNIIWTNATGTNTTSTNFAVTRVTDNFLPAGDGTLALGTNSLRWNGIFLNVTSTNATTSNLAVTGSATTSFAFTVSSTQYLANPGSAATPGFTFSGGTGNGIYADLSVPRILLVTGGVARLRCDSGDCTINQTLQMGANIQPSTNNTYDLGTSSLAWNDIFASGTTALADLSFTNATATLLDFRSGGRITSQGANLRRTVFLTGSGGFCALATGCSTTSTQFATASNAVNFYPSVFDATTTQYQHWTIAMPDSYDGGTLSATFYWTATATTGNVVWGIAGQSYSDDDALAGSWGTAVTATDAFIANEDLHTTTTATNFTIANTPAGSDLIAIRVFRDAADTNFDTMARAAQLLMVKLEYVINAITD